MRASQKVIKMVLPLPPPQQKKVSYWLLFGFIVVIFGVVLFLFRHKIDNLIKHLRHRLDVLYDEQPFFVGLLITLIVCGIQVFILPMHTLAISCGAYVFRNFAKSFAIFLMVTLLGSTIVYYAVKFFLKNYVNEKLKHNDIFFSIKAEMQESPWKLSIFARFLMIPNGLKDYILSILDENFLRYLTCSLIANSLFVLEGCLIGYGLRMFDPLTPSPPWRIRPLKEKIITFFYVLFSVLAIVALVVVGSKATKLIMNPRKADQEEARREGFELVDRA